MTQGHGFDRHAARYDEDCMRGLAVSGEDRDYFARGRAAALRALWARLGLAEPRTVIDLGCGTGDGTVRLAEAFAGARVLGLDPSTASIALARSRWAGGACEFAEDAGEALPPAGLVHLSGVLHHVPPPERDALLRRAAAALAPGGALAVFENNPLNPGTRWVMSRIPFDRDAVPLRAAEARRRAAAAGLRPLAVRYHFYFPRWLRALRPLEPALQRLPLGAQYLVLARRD
jgi:trans-aconitate methyltransferase